MPDQEQRVEYAKDGVTIIASEGREDTYIIDIPCSYAVSTAGQSGLRVSAHLTHDQAFALMGGLTAALEAQWGVA